MYRVSIFRLVPKLQSLTGYNGNDDRDRISAVGPVLPRLGRTAVDGAYLERVTISEQTAKLIEEDLEVSFNRISLN